MGAPGAPARSEPGGLRAIPRTDLTATTVDWMVPVQGPTIEADIGTKPARLNKLLRGVVALFGSETGPSQNVVDVPAVRFNVITDFCRRDDAAL